MEVGLGKIKVSTIAPQSKMEVGLGKIKVGLKHQIFSLSCSGKFYVVSKMQRIY